jgi:hypothetical protein
MTDRTVIRPARRIKTFNPDFLAVAAFSIIGILVILNAMLRFADLRMLIGQYNQF